MMIEVLSVYLEKSFGPVKALSQVSFELTSGSYVALLGANGAGKSTLLKCLGGLIKPDKTLTRLNGKNYAPRSPAEALRAGVVSIYQDLSLIESWKVWHHFASTSDGFFLSEKLAKERAEAALETINIDLSLDAEVIDLPASQKQLLEVAKSLQFEPELLLVDEPTAGISTETRNNIFRIFSEIAASGTIVIVATHDVTLALNWCKTVVHLEDAKLGYFGVTENYRKAINPQTSRKPRGMRKTWKSDENDIKLMIGVGDANCDTSNVTLPNATVLGVVAHPLGNGRELLRSIAGFSRVLSAHLVAKKGRQKLITSYMSRERSNEWVFSGHSICFNLNASTFRKHQNKYWMDQKKEQKNAVELSRLVSLTYHDIHQAVDGLSGGNKQRVVLARHMSAEPDVLLLDEPFSGVDQDTRAQLVKTLHEYSTGRRLVIIFSEEFEDLIRCCNFILVFPRSKGHKAFSVVDTDDLSPDKLNVLLEES